ncbi:MAG: amino acid ABC transporter ATP-binding protein [Alphaproteobacteria bacterium]|nr:amino acid ABC transporter ATP-binding protein [Alphaproteobacteria bacterium]
MPHLDIRNVSSAYGRVEVLSDVTLTVDQGQVVALVGPSGSGKSTLLRVLMGLNRPTTGEILVHDEPVDYASKASVRAARDRMAIVFQQYNLFQNMDVMRNVTVAPIKIKGRRRAEVEEDAHRLLAKVGLADKHYAFPDQLSGGQQQRVAIARALALKPEILLLDEVTSALDPELVNEVLDTIRNLVADGMTMLIVSHEMAFVREVADMVVMMDKGQVVEMGLPRDIIDDPKTQRAKDFFGKILRH